METFVLGRYFENTYLITKGNQAILVDPGENILNILDVINKYDLKAIILNHGHIDHVDGIKEFLDKPIYIYKDELEVLKSKEYSLYSLYDLELPYNIDKLNLHLLSDLEEFKLLDYNIKVIHTPGHTKGSCCYLFDNKVLFSGDTLFQVGIGRTDYPTGDMNQMILSLNRLYKLDDSIKVYPGHGVETTIGFEKKYNPYFK